MTEQIKEISSKTAWDFLKPRHYAGRKPQNKCCIWSLCGV